MTSKQWQLSNDAALRYEQVLVKAILGPFAKALVDWADLQPGSTVVDIGCGTGAATRFAAEKIGRSGKVIGVDINPGMLDVAQSLSFLNGASIEWRQENAVDLSLADESVDAVLCAQTLQFLPEKQRALNEMYCVLKPGQSAYLSLWCPIDENPYFNALVNAVAAHIGEDTAAGLGSAFNLSAPDDIHEVTAGSAFEEPYLTTSEIYLDLPPIADFVPDHINATPMAAAFNASSPEAQAAILDDLSSQLANFQTNAGLHVPFRTHLVTLIKPQ